MIALCVAQSSVEKFLQFLLNMSKFDAQIITNFFRKLQDFTINFRNIQILNDIECAIYLEQFLKILIL